MHIEYTIKLDFKDVLLKPKRSTLSSREDVDLIREFKFKYSPYIFKGIGIIASNMDGVGTFSMAKELQKHKMLTIIRKHYTVKEWKIAIKKGLGLNNIGICIGSNKNKEDYRVMKVILLSNPDIQFICIDVANGYHQNFSNFVSKIRDEWPNKIIIAGNVVTAEMTEELILRGADIVKIGTGSGAVCVTRAMTGVGIPQFSAIIECADAANGIGGHIIADGGCTNPGDIVKAFGAGAHFVMIGGMLAGHDESETGTSRGDIIEFYGMSSDKAMLKYKNKKDYRGSEGKIVKLINQGPVKNTILEILSGVRSACTYIGARRIKDMPKCATFVRCNSQINNIFSNEFNKR